MLLDKLTFDEKQRFLDLAYYMVNVDTTKTLNEEEVLEGYKLELGDMSAYKKLPVNKAVAKLKKSSKLVKRIILMNLIKISLADDFYHAEEHLFIEDLLEEWEITPKKKAELVKLVYQEKDLREKVKIAVSQ